MNHTGLHAQYRRLEREITQGVRQVLEEGRYIMGPQVGELERRLAAFVGRRHCICVGSGTDALLLALMAEGIGPGDLVFTTAFSFFATAEAICLAGATPVFCDINPTTYNLDPQLLSRAVRTAIKSGGMRPRAVIAVDLFGLCADYEALEELCEDRNLVLIEDACQSMGAVQGGRRAGAFGKYGATSFFPTKPLGCCGDGGALFCDDDQAAALLRSLREHGRGEEKYQNLRVGLNARLDTLQAAILLPKLAILEEEIQARRQVAAGYSKALGGLVRVPNDEACLTSAFAQYTIAVKDRSVRDSLLAGLAERGIEARVYYPTALNRQPAFRDLSQRPMPNAEEMAGRVLSLPMHPYLTQEEQQEVEGAVVELLQENEKECDRNDSGD